jgi:hypothetical protein
VIQVGVSCNPPLTMMLGRLNSDAGGARVMQRGHERNAGVQMRAVQAAQQGCKPEGAQGWCRGGTSGMHGSGAWDPPVQWQQESRGVNPKQVGNGARNS